MSINVPTLKGLPKMSQGSHYFYPSLIWFIWIMRRDESKSLINPTQSLEVSRYKL